MQSEMFITLVLILNSSLFSIHTGELIVGISICICIIWQCITFNVLVGGLIFRRKVPGHPPPSK